LRGKILAAKFEQQKTFVENIDWQTFQEQKVWWGGKTAILFVRMSQQYSLINFALTYIKSRILVFSMNTLWEDLKTSHCYYNFLAVLTPIC
jgi:hypothetical protein